MCILVPVPLVCAVTISQGKPVPIRLKAVMYRRYLIASHLSLFK